ncbi:MAG TPA: RDD family protein [Luteolibacter sp.]|nr:RDD family protein [Luteolibacter sp.]
MDVWIIENGEKSGPLPDFEVRSRIRAGVLTSETPAWHDGLAEWRPLADIPLFANDFDESSSNSTEKPDTDRDQPPPLPQTSPGPPPHLIRRFWARWFDLYLYSGFWWLGMWAAGRDIGAVLENVWLILFQYLPWFAIEAFLLHRFGTTPGKWLLGIRVRNDDGSPLALGEATRRSMRVLFLGIGLGWGILALLCQLMAFFTTRRLGRPLWDMAGGHRLETTPLHPVKIATYVVGLFIALQMQMIVVWPHIHKQMEETFPALREQIEKNPPWHLPDNRSR